LHGPVKTVNSKALVGDGRMLRPLKGPSISLGKGIVMTIAKLKKKESAQGAAETKKNPCSNVFEGKVVSITGNKLVMKNKEGTAYSHTLATDAKLIRDGKAFKADDLKAGTEIRVTTKKDDRNLATGIECLTKNKGIANCCS
jgi:hypothetical protein